MRKNMGDRFLTRRKAAELLGVSEALLRKLDREARRSGCPDEAPPVVRVGSKLVRYHEPSLLAWATKRGKARASSAAIRVAPGTTRDEVSS
jgi:predicted DNA-binding transcriptional regulator AlpA